MRLIIADLDGTLVHKKEMTQRTKDTITQLNDTNYLFTLATGRHKDAARGLVKELGVTLPVICTNGAMIYDFEKEVIIHQDVIAPDEAMKVLAILNEQEASYLLYTTASIVSTKQAKNRLESRIGTFNSEVVNETELHNYLSLGLLKILVIEPDELKFSHLRKQLSALSQVYVLSSQAAFLDIGNINASKGRALEILCHSLNVDMQDVLAIGDQENDLSMVLKAGLGVAMGNGEDILKAQADFVTKPFSEDGFAHAIDTLVFKK